MSRESSPKRSTIFVAVEGPTPFIAPEDRYLNIAAAFCGVFL